MQIWIFGMTY